MEEDGADVVQMPIEREQASPGLVRPHLDFVVVSARDEQWLRLVEIDAANWPIVLLKTVY